MWKVRKNMFCFLLNTSNSYGHNKNICPTSGLVLIQHFQIFLSMYVYIFFSELGKYIFVDLSGYW